MNLKNKIKTLLMRNDFFELENLLKNTTLNDIEKNLISIAFDNGSVVVYTVICMMLIREETAKLHYAAARLLMHPLCHFEGAYAAALYHVREAVKLDPKDKGLKEVLIFLHEVPDKVVSREEAIAIAKKLLKEEPDNKCAKNLLKWYGLL